MTGSLKNTVGWASSQLGINWTIQIDDLLLSAGPGSTRDVEMAERRSLHFRNPQLFRKDKTFTEMPTIQGRPPACPFLLTAESSPRSPQAGTP